MASGAARCPGPFAAAAAVVLGFLRRDRFVGPFEPARTLPDWMAVPARNSSSCARELARPGRRGCGPVGGPTPARTLLTTEKAAQEQLLLQKKQLEADVLVSVDDLGFFSRS